jgi:hypothetical protein
VQDLDLDPFETKEIAERSRSGRLHMVFSLERHPIRCPTQDERVGVSPIGMNTTGSFLNGSLPWGRSAERPGAPIVAPTEHLRSSDLALGTYHPMGMGDRRRHAGMEGLHMAHSAVRRSGGLTLPPTNQHSIINHKLPALPASPRRPVVADAGARARAPNSPRLLRPMANRPAQPGSARGVRGAVQPDAAARPGSAASERQAAMVRMTLEQTWTTNSRSYGAGGLDASSQMPLRSSF